MKNTLLLLMFILNFSFWTHAQNNTPGIKSGEIRIPLNTTLRITVVQNNGALQQPEILETGTLDQPIDVMEAMKGSRAQAKEAQEIAFTFGDADFMGSKYIVLNTLHHLKDPIIFKARIKIKGFSEEVETSIVSIPPNALSVEQWRDDIEYIVLYDLKVYDETH